MLLFALPVAAARGAGWEIEASLGATSGDEFTRRTPFEYQGITFGGPYNACKLPIVLCNAFSGSDVGYSLRSRYPFTGIVGIDASHDLGRSFRAGAGLLVGLGPRTQTLFRDQTGDLIYTRPEEPADERQKFTDAPTATNNGAGALAYLHAGLRWEHRFETASSAIGRRPASLGIFVEGGAGVLAALPGEGDAALGRPAAVHALAGLRIHRRLGHDLLISVLHVQAIADTDHLLRPRFRWTGGRIGLAFGR